MRYFITVVVLLAVACAPTILHAEIVPTAGTVSLPDLFDHASVIFAGEVVSVESKGKVNSKWYGREVELEVFAATVAVDRLYKGESNGAVLRVIYHRPAGNVCTVSKCEMLTAGEYGLFFLQEQGDGYHMIEQIYEPFAVSRLKSAVHERGLARLESDLVAGLQDADENRLLTNVELIGALKHVSSVSPLLDLLSRNPSGVVRSAIYVALLRLQYIGKLRESLLFAESSTTGSPAELRIKDQIFDLVGVVHDPTAVQVLIGFAHSQSDRLRESVIQALREIASPTAVPIFVEALDDRLKLIRYDAVLGLATVERNWDIAPSVDTFSANEAKYVDAWKSWWLNSGKELYR
jgi:hypothetical protein